MRNGVSLSVSERAPQLTRDTALRRAGDPLPL
jgi:hypothetical protein